MGAAVLVAPPASADLGSVGPTDPASLFPTYFQDENGVRLQMCQDGPPRCLAGPELMQDIHADPQGDAEAFYFHASAEIGEFTLEAALEAAYAGPGPDQEVVFQRRQGIARGVTPNGTYTFTDPYGSYTCTADGSGRVQPSKGCRFETNPIPGDFDVALTGDIGPFLTWNTFGSAADGPPAGFIGDGATPHQVVGSPNGFNKMRVSGPGISGTCTNADGSTVPNCDETDLLIIQGKVQPGGAVGQLSAGTLDFGDVPTSPAVTKTLTYANVGDAPITISSIDRTGSGAAAFAVGGDCPTAPAALAVGSRCTIDVTFTPDPGNASTAALTIVDSTPVGTRNVALRGSNLPHMFVSDPRPPNPLAFGIRPLNADSPEDHVVIGNDGNGPLQGVSAEITGASRTHYRVGTNGCTAAVIPESGCEIGVVFRPTSTGSKSATLHVTATNGPPVDIPLTGTGAAADVVAPTMSQISGSLSGTTVTLTWGPATDDVAVTGYRVFRNGAQLGATLPGTAGSFSDPGRPAGSSNSYTVRALDAAGNVSAPSNTVALTVPVANPNQPPTVTARTPADALTAVAVTANVTATFSEAVTGVSGATFTLRNAAGTSVGAGVSYNATTRVATLNPTANLAADTRYTATLTSGIRDRAASPASLAVTTWSFTTGPRPALTARTPAVNATGVSRTANVTATFGERVTGVSGASVKLRNPAGAEITAVVSYNATTRVVTLNPSATLVARTVYRVSLTGVGANGIRDLAGNPLTTTSWSFTTGA